MSAVVVITGSSVGIGFELARAWAAAGASLVLNARDVVQLEAARVALVREFPAAAIELVPGDVTDAAVQTELVQRARTRFGRLDVLVNNAGRGYYARFAEIAVGELGQLFALNVLAPLSLTQHALPALAESGGTVVMVSSVAGVAAAPMMGAYAASKFALEALAISLRAEVASRGIHVLVARPGPVATAFRDHAIATAAESLTSPETGKDDRQPAADVARRIVAGVAARRAVVETSLYVHGASFLARALPSVFGLVTRRMAKR